MILKNASACFYGRGFEREAITWFFLILLAFSNDFVQYQELHLKTVQLHLLGLVTFTLHHPDRLICTLSERTFPDSEMIANFLEFTKSDDLFESACAWTSTDPFRSDPH